jgi:hypothetical protein
MLLEIDRISHSESYIQEDKAMCATCLGWSDLTTEERVKILCRGRVVKGVEMGEWHAEGEDYVRWARKMFRETGLCFNKSHYDFVFSSSYIEGIFQKVVNNKVKTIFQYGSSGRTDEIEELLVQLRRLRMERFDNDNTPELITVMYYIELTDKDKELLVALQRLGFPNTL